MLPDLTWIDCLSSDVSLFASTVICTSEIPMSGVLKLELVLTTNMVLLDSFFISANTIPPYKPSPLLYDTILPFSKCVLLNSY